MKFCLYVGIVAITVFACNRKVPAEAATISKDTFVSAVSGADIDAPACILKKIDSLQKVEVWNPPAEINEYEYEGKKVYTVSARCCDFFTILVDSNCHYICAPSGGFTGRGDGKCRDFLQQAKHLRLVWKDNRNRK